MQKIKLQNQKIQRMRTYHYISIPKAFIDNGLLSTEKTYKVTIEEISETLKNPTNQSQIKTIPEESI